MSLTLDEMNEDWEKRHTVAITTIPDDSEDEDEDDDEFDPEASLNEACDLLTEVMEFLGNFGQLRHVIGANEKREMLGYAQQIYQFLEDIGEVGDETK